MQASSGKSINLVLLSLLLVFSGIRSSDMRSASQATFRLINNYRRSLGLQQMRWDEQVYQLCARHNLYQAQRNTISHDGYQDRNRRLGGYANENVAAFWGFNQSNDDFIARKFFDMWRKSPGHDRNMRDGKMNAGAVAVFYSAGSRGYFATNMNARR